MLKLKRLQILGFKSFCDRTELTFQGDGIVAIVGPNGCGKSNIADAISWVLGEQSVKTLRGSRMEDVIFAGTRNRKSTGMAEVSLTLVDPDLYGAGPALPMPGDAEADALLLEGDIDRDGDWDEASLQNDRAAETELAWKAAQPLGSLARTTLEQGEEAAGDENTTAAGDADNSTQAEAAAQPGVLLKIRRRQLKPISIRSEEIVVTRRLFRTGESEYLMNGKFCRLRDIQDLFMGTGLGPETYAIIEQGRIGQILSSKPHDRRAIIEEAAGITKFKTRKRLAEARLEQARGDLSRINDIFEEITRQMNSLKRQTAKAERYARLRDQMREKFRAVMGGKFLLSSAELQARQEELRLLAQEIASDTAVVAQSESAHSERMQRGYTIENESHGARERLAAVMLETERTHADRLHNQHRCAELVTRFSDAQADLGRVEHQLRSLLTEQEGNQTLLQSADSDVHAASLNLSALQSHAAAAATALADIESGLDAQRQSLMEVIASAAEVNNQISQAQEALSAIEREWNRLEREREQAESEAEIMGARRSQLKSEYEHLAASASSLSARIGATRSSIAAGKTAESTAKNELDTLRAEFATALGRRNSLSAIIQEHGYSTESVKRLFQSGALSEGFAPAGLLADFIEVDEQYEAVVEDFLRDELNYVVVKSWDSANQGLRLLQTGVDGRATFLVHPEDSQARFSFNVTPSTYHTPVPDSTFPLTRCMRVLNGFGKSLEVVLPKLGDGFITPDSKTARELALDNPKAYFLSPAGECFHNVTVTGGTQRTEGPLSMKRELRDATRQLAEIERAMQAATARVQSVTEELNRHVALLAQLQEEQRRAELEVMTSSHTMKQLEADLARAELRTHVCEQEASRLQIERAQRGAWIAERRAQMASFQKLRAGLEKDITEAQQMMGDLKIARDQSARNAAEMASTMAVIEERRRAALASVERLDSMVVEVTMRSQSLQAQMSSALAEQEQRQREIDALNDRALLLQAEARQVTAVAHNLQAESEVVRARIAGIEADLKAARLKLDTARDTRGEVAAVIAKLNSDIEYMAESCRTELGATLQDLAAQAGAAGLSSESLALQEGAYREMRARLEAMGPVNMMALEEYEEVSQRHQFLGTQRHDLVESIDNTQNAIHEIDTVSREKFEHAFARINENFQMTFYKLFGGGHAFMRLTDEDNTADSGIDVVASPPGKKLQNVLLLSGGEKALTALSLLVGIFQYQPSPFCVLDEVDAPLDEANIRRFTDMVREMSAQTQFVLITHSRKTMSIAPVMYGVTMQEPGVSRIVSVRVGQEQPRQAAIA